MQKNYNENDNIPEWENIESKGISRVLSGKWKHEVGV